MTDDIVTRLREHALEGIWDFTKCSWDIQEAADEIERLRVKLRRWEVCDAIAEGLCGWDSEETYCDPCKAVRGD